MKWMSMQNHITYRHVWHNSECAVTGIETDSRKVKPGHVFVCLEGEHVDGHAYIDQAIENGAVVIVAEKEVERRSGITYLMVASTVRALAEMSSYYYGNPSADMQVIGVTGTNGKTSITQFLNQLYRLNGYTTGMMGTIHTDIDGVVTESQNTTPFSHDLQRTLAEMREQNVSHVFMEVSSHALAMGRVWGCQFQQGVFTNLTRDHLDYHRTMEDYLQAKSLLFASLGNDFRRTAIVNADEPDASYIQSVSGGKVLTYGLEKESDVQAVNLSFSSGLCFDIVYQGNVYPVRTSLVGRFHVYNLLAVVCVALADGWDMQDIIHYLPQLQAVKGRMETVDCGQDFSVIVDYAHTPDALEKALQSLERNSGGRVLTVVGCGGNRDKTKRPLMAKIAEYYSDHVYLTSDNPREEEPTSILIDMEEGMEHKDYTILVDRKEALEKAIQDAETGDIILIAGKGHEEYQIIGTQKQPFSDVACAKRFIERRKQKQA